MSRQKRVLVSSCLLGRKCRYDGEDNENKRLLELLKDHVIVEVCPEELGGLPTPRTPCEIKGSGSIYRVVSKTGEDCTLAFEVGAQKSVEIGKRFCVDFAILKAKSPSCGSGQIYDGTFKGKLIEGDGCTTMLLKKEGIVVYNEGELVEIEEQLVKD